MQVKGQITASYIYVIDPKSISPSLLSKCGHGSHTITVNFRKQQIQIVYHTGWGSAQCFIPTKETNLMNPITLSVKLFEKGRAFQSADFPVKRVFLPLEKNKEYPFVIDNEQIKITLEDGSVIHFKRFRILQELHFCQKYMCFNMDNTYEFMTAKENMNNYSILYTSSVNLTPVSLRIDSIEGVVGLMGWQLSPTFHVSFPGQAQTLYSCSIGFADGGFINAPVLGVSEIGKQDDAQTFNIVYPLDSLFFPFSDAVFNLYSDNKYQTKITFNRFSPNKIEVIWSETGKADQKTQAYDINNENGFFRFDLPGRGKFFLQNLPKGGGWSAHLYNYTKKERLELTKW